MDNLKKYLQQHTDEMDFDNPPAEVWNNIEKVAVEKKTGRLFSLSMRIAAAAVIVVAIAIGIKLSRPQKTIVKAADDIVVVTTPQNNSIADSVRPALTAADSSSSAATAAAPVKKSRRTKQADQRYAMMESFKESYGELVSYQISSIRSTPVYAEDPAYFDDFKTRLRQMDTDELAIRNRIRRQGMSNNLLEQLINVYQQKLDVLKSLQAEINKMNERVKENPATDSLSKYYLNI